MLKVENLSRSFGEKKAVDNISFSVRPGVITGLLGPNGAGKTTTMRLITGYLEPSSGFVYFGGNLLSDDMNAIQKKLGYLPESAPLYPEMKVSEYLEYMAAIRAVPKEKRKGQIEEMVSVCELESKIDSPVSFLSKGFKQRLALAGTLVHDPEVIILDEPTTGLDPNQISQIRNLIKKLGKSKTLILSTHILKEVEDVCDEVIIINNGKIVANSSVKSLYGETKVLVTVNTGIDNLRKHFTGDEFIDIEFYSGYEHSDDTYKSFLISLKDDKPELVFYQLSKANFMVKEIRLFKRSLESIFSDLTRN